MCKIATLNFSMGFNIVAPYMVSATPECSPPTLMWFLHDIQTNMYYESLQWAEHHSRDKSKTNHDIGDDDKW